MARFSRHRDDEEEWLGGRRGTAIAAFAFLVLVGISGIVVVATGGSDTSGEPAHPSAGPPQSGIADDAWDGTTRPQGVSWSLYRGMALPSSPTAGPARDDGVVAAGYAHSRVGALLAAVQTPVRYVAAPDADWRRATLAMLAPGPGRDAWARTRAVERAKPDPPGTTYAVVTGFSFVSYSDADAVIQVVGRNPDGSSWVDPYHLVWLDGDWKLVLAADGMPSPNSQQVSSLDGFVPWSPA